MRYTESLFFYHYFCKMKKTSSRVNLQLRTKIDNQQQPKTKNKPVELKGYFSVKLKFAT